MADSNSEAPKTSGTSLFADINVTSLHVDSPLITSSLLFTYSIALHDSGDQNQSQKKLKTMKGTNALPVGRQTVKTGSPCCYNLRPSGMPG